MKKLILILILFSLTHLITKAQVNLQNGLIIHYPFNGNANDESGNNNNGIINGATLTSDRFERDDSAYSFDGINDYIISLDFDTSLFTNQFSVSVWIKINSLSAGYKALIFNGNAAGFFLTQDGSNIIYYITDKLSTYNNFFSGSDWMHLVITYNGTILKFYKNNSILEEKNHSIGDYPVVGNKLFIGGANYSYSYCGNFNGKIDDIRFYNRELNQQEIRTLYFEDNVWVVNPVIFNEDTVIVCNNNSVILRANKDSSLTYQWLKNDTIINGATSDTCIVSELGDYKVVETNKYYSETSKAVKVIKFSVFVDDITITCGTVAQVSTITNYPDTENLSYLWSPEEGLSAINIAQPTVNIINDKTYTVSVTAPNGCIVVDSLSVIVNPLIVFANDVNVMCGTDAQLNVATNYSGTDTLIYNWSPTDYLDTPFISNPIASKPKPILYRVDVTTANGCTANKDIQLNTYVTDLLPSICMVTVNDSDKNVIIWESELTSLIDTFCIYRESSSQTDQYNLIGKLSYVTSGMFTDSTSDARVQSNKYKISIKDLCGNETEKSAEHKTMHLTINKGTGKDWNLYWEQYFGVPVQSYQIYRGISKSELSFIGSTSGSNSSYTDINAPSGKVYYQLEIDLPQSCSNLKSADYTCLHSNIVSTSVSTNVLSEKIVNKSFVYPNPADKVIYITSGNYIKPQVLIYNLRGTLLFDKQITSDECIVDISSFVTGIYIVKLVDSDKVSINMFIKE